MDPLTFCYCIESGGVSESIKTLIPGDGFSS